jgi:hypothetical protein
MSFYNQPLQNSTQISIIHYSSICNKMNINYNKNCNGSEYNEDRKEREELNV